MDLHQRTLRVGLMAVLCAAVFRLCSMDLPGMLREWIQSPNFKTFLSCLETGRDVRFSPSVESFSPDFVETPPPVPEETPKAPLPAFSADVIPEVFYAGRVRPDLAALLARPLSWDLCAGAPSVLILHTHATESYTRSAEHYEETAAYRTLDEGYNMLSVGAHLASLLARSGIGVIHDRTLHDYPSYNGAYAAARKTLRSYLEAYPSIRLVLDLHRDASEGSGGQLRTLAHTPEASLAQLMVVIGTGHSGFEDNLSLGLKLHAQLEAQVPGITRPLQLRTQRFNQDLFPGALLIEVGAAGNTRQEALAAAEQLAQALSALALGTLAPEDNKPTQN